ncbi:uncharacterized protein EHS24_001146 [Apiotrichum porosum]|uniref:Uncharacterized protein n=1 Tax=Apiotrichum porosum TaxID=105984 RepID=A0A427XJV3_9TREE|nr:uncharacterized protein EHS24_001146 [Apiotrichum porosum]RSH79108.1 hypothetical protein EHS24_001146 [Apiotrichum porosum]
MPTRVNEMDTPAHPVNKVVTGAGGKVLAEHYKSSGDEAADTLAFLHLLGQLKAS